VVVWRAATRRRVRVKGASSSSCGSSNWFSSFSGSCSLSSSSCGSSDLSSSSCGTSSRSSSSCGSSSRSSSSSVSCSLSSSSSGTSSRGDLRGLSLLSVSLMRMGDCARLRFCVSGGKDASPTEELSSETSPSIYPAGVMDGAICRASLNVPLRGVVKGGSCIRGACMLGPDIAGTC
jgi:hypothetical protein